MTDNPYYVPGAPEDTSKDHIVRAVGLSGKVKCLALSASGLCEEARRIHGTDDAVALQLGKFMMGSLLISESMKRPTDTQTTLLRTNGALKGITCVTDYGFKVRAYPHVNAIPEGEAPIDGGSLTVIRDVGLKEPYSGSTELVSSELSKNFAYYLVKSEQTPAIVTLGTEINGDKLYAAALMIQLMPGAGEEEISYLEGRASQFPDCAYLLTEGFTPAKILDLFMGDPDLEYLSGEEIGFECNCSREHMYSALATLGKDDIRELIDSGENITTECHFCGSKYEFTPDEIRKITGL